MYNGWILGLKRGVICEICRNCEQWWSSYHDSEEHRRPEYYDTTSYANFQKFQDVLSVMTRPASHISGFASLEPKEWMDAIRFKEWLGQPIAINKLPHGQRRLQYVYNCTGHRVSDNNPAALQHIGSTLQTFPPNTMYLIQIAELFILRTLKMCGARSRTSTRWNLLETMDETLDTERSRTLVKLYIWNWHLLQWGKLINNLMRKAYNTPAGWWL